MKTKLLFLAVLFYCNLYSQFGPPQIIPSNVNGLNSVFSADFDGDGGMDVVSSSKIDKKIVWYENSNGNGTYTNQHLVSANTDNGGLNFVYAADIDNDNDMDIVAAYDYGIFWFENLDGQGSFSDAKLISYDVDIALSVQAVDIDGDGNKDVVSSNTYNDSQISWFKNTDGLGNFGPSQQIAGSGINGPNYFSVNDIDGDGDMDIVASAYDIYFPDFSGNYIAWYENTDGKGNFGPKQTILTSAGSPSALLTIDIDNDGDFDIVVASEWDNEVYILENLDGLGTFSDKIILPFALVRPRSLFSFDYFNNGNQDILIACQDKITLLVNNGQGNFNQELIVSDTVDGGVSVFASDLNGNNAIDIIAASYNDNVIAWYKNQTLLIEGNNAFDFSVYPIPTTDILNIESKSQIANLEIYNQLGQQLMNAENLKTIDISSLSKGIYFIKITDINQSFGVRKIVKN